MAFKPGLPSEGADNKEAAKVWEAGGGCVKLTAALNPSSRRGLDPIRPAQPRTAWQGLSCRRHQRADEDGGPSVSPPPQLHKLVASKRRTSAVCSSQKNTASRERGFARLRGVYRKTAPALQRRRSARLRKKEVRRGDGTRFNMLGDGVEKPDLHAFDAPRSSSSVVGGVHGRPLLLLQRLRLLQTQQS